MQPQTPRSIIALDVGSVRVGVAVASLIARLPRPLATLDRERDFFIELQNLISVEEAGALIVGFPRGMQGQSTAQTEAIQDFVKELKEHVSLPIVFQDEALTSKKAEAELDARGTNYSKADVDALAATYILEYFLSEHDLTSDLGDLFGEN